MYTQEEVCLCVFCVNNYDLGFFLLDPDLEKAGKGSQIHQSQELDCTCSASFLYKKPC